MKLDYTGGINSPERVAKRSSEITDLLLEDNFLESESISPNIFYRTLFNKLLEKWTAGDNLELSEDEMIQVISISSATSVLEDLKRKGLINSIEDESGEDVFFLTEEGKYIAEHLSKKLNEI